jgi:hypothetical protein
MPNPSKQKANDLIQLQEEKQTLEDELKALKRERNKSKLENDALKEASKLRKKLRVSIFGR